MPLFMDELNAVLAMSGAPRPKTEWSMKQNSFQLRVLALDRLLGCKAKGPPERKGRRGAERHHRALFRRVYENQNFPHQRFVSPVKCSPLGKGAPRTYPRKTDSTVNVSPSEATPKPIPTFEMFERQVDAAGYSWVEMVGTSLRGYRTLPEGWCFDFENKRVVRMPENMAPASQEETPPVKKEEKTPVKEEDKTTAQAENKAPVASAAGGSSISGRSSAGGSAGVIPSSSSSSSSRKRRADSIEDPSVDYLRDPTSKRARHALPSEQLPPLAPLQLLSSTTTPVIPTIGGLQPFGQGKAHHGLQPRKKPQRDNSPSRILKNARFYNSEEPYLKRKAEEVDFTGNFEDSRKSKKQMRNHHMDKAEGVNTIDSTNEHLTKHSAEPYRGANQKPQNSNKPPTRAHMHNEPSISTTLKDAMRKVQRKVQNSWDISAPSSLGLQNVVKLWESRKGVKKSGSSSSTTQPSYRRAGRPKPKPYVIDLRSAEQSEQSVKRSRVHKAEESKMTDSKDQNSPKQPMKPRCNVARPKTSKSAEDTIHKSKKPTGLALSAPAAMSTHKPVRVTNSFELIGPRPIFECGINGAHFLPLRFWQNDEDGNRGTKPIELPWPEFRGITVEDLDWNSAEHICWLNKWAGSVLQHFGC